MSSLFESIFIFLGCFFALTAAIGLYRFPDFYCRMHSAGKVSSYGIGFLLMAVIVRFPQIDIIVKSGLCILFILLTAPIGAHVLMRVGYHLGVPVTERGKIDEYKKRRTSEDS